MVPNYIGSPHCSACEVVVQTMKRLIGRLTERESSCQWSWEVRIVESLSYGRHVPMMGHHTLVRAYLSLIRTLETNIVLRCNKGC